MTRLLLVGEVAGDENTDIAELREDIKRLQNENEQLRRDYEAKMRALHREYSHLVNENEHWNLTPPDRGSGSLDALENSLNYETVLCRKV